jgi:hypothetical protein
MRRLLLVSPFVFGLLFGLARFGDSDEDAVFAVRPAEAGCQDLHKEDGRCDCTDETCGSLKDCVAGYEPCDDRTPPGACDTPGHEGEKCVYKNDPDMDNECPPPDVCGY